MSKFIWKPKVMDFGYEPGVTKQLRFIHLGQRIEVFSHPDWLTDVKVEFTPLPSIHDSDHLPEKGVLTATVRYDSTRHQESGLIGVSCDGEIYFIPAIFNYDSEHVPVLDVIDSLLLRIGDKGHIGREDRPKALLVAKRWLQDNGGITGKNVRFAELKVLDNEIALPGDFVDYIGLYRVTGDGFLLPLYFNKNINIGQENLKDESDFRLLDDAGYVISGYGLTPRVGVTDRYSFLNVNLQDLNSHQRVYQIRPGVLSSHGMYKYDPANRVFYVSAPDLTEVVLEYVSDPLLRHKLKMDFGEIRIHKNYQEALEAHIYLKLIELDRYVPFNEKQRALTEYKLAMKRASARKLSLSELIQVLKGNK